MFSLLLVSVDVVFVINKCGIGDEKGQQRIRTFIKESSRSLQIGRNGDHVAVVTAKDEPTVEWDLSR